MQIIPQTLHTWDTELSADSVEWCPNKGYENILAVGTYQVEKSDDSETFSSSQRSGKITLHKIDNDLILLQTLNVAAVLDMKWAPEINDNISDTEIVPKLAVVDAKGMILSCAFDLIRKTEILTHNKCLF